MVYETEDEDDWDIDWDSEDEYDDEEEASGSMTPDADHQDIHPVQPDTGEFVAAASIVFPVHGISFRTGSLV